MTAPATPAAAGRAVGVFGGSFDPPHLAHRALAGAALAQLGLERVLWLPAGQPWQKAGRALASGAHRVAMLRLLTAGEPRFEIDERELRRAGPTYSVDTLRELRAEQPGTMFWLILGADQFARLPTWHEWQALPALAGLAVAARGDQAVQAPAGLAALPHTLRLVAMPALSHSASAVRARCAAAEEVATLVGAPVARYIADHHLYGA